MIETTLAASAIIALGLTLTPEEREKLEYLRANGDHADRVARLLLELED